MIKPIMTRQFFLRQPSEEATGVDAQIARDLADTLEANRATCVGMAERLRTTRMADPHSMLRR